MYESPNNDIEASRTHTHTLKDLKIICLAIHISIVKDKFELKSREYSPISGKTTTCFVCPPGLYQEATSGCICTPCATSTFSTGQGLTNLTKALDCIHCAKGSYTIFTEIPAFTTQCSLCPPGRYMNKSGWSGTACTACNPGTFSSKISGYENNSSN
jgi:hypothetical protein